MREDNLKYRDLLLSDIARGVAKLNQDRVCNIRVRLYCGRHMVKEILGLAAALDIIANYLYFDEESNWSEADHADVDTY